MSKKLSPIFYLRNMPDDSLIEVLFLHWKTRTKYIEVKLLRNNLGIKRNTLIRIENMLAFKNIFKGDQIWIKMDDGGLWVDPDEKYIYHLLGKVLKSKEKLFRVADESIYFRKQLKK
jgi:hypothetical protein